jgi:hypothetical protein
MRNPTVAGQFYARDPSGLENEISRCFGDLDISQQNIHGSVIPHAGYMFSGPVAAYAFAQLPKADTYIILGPNHTGLGSAVAISQDTWSTPLGNVETDKELGKSLAGSILDIDEMAHMYEHSIEVQIPFLQYRFSHDFRVLPICMGLQDEETALEVGNQISSAITESNKKIFVIASSDLTHFEPENVANDTDKYLIESIENMDIHEFYRRISERSATACGYGPISAMLTVAKSLGGRTGKLLKYGTSADVTGDSSSVVGYAAVVIE